MASFIATGGRFPILLVTCNRVDQLRRTLAALLAVRCVEADDVLVVADGGCDAPEVPSVVAAAGMRLHTHRRPAASPGEDGAARIASHYGYALAIALGGGGGGDGGGPAAAPPGVIVVEDDMAFAPDFFEYFHAVAALLEADPTLWLASAWHDNGFDYLVADPLRVRRTRYFPGLGWLLPRAVWEAQLQRMWPPSHWDHWLREPAQHRGRDVLYPEVPRSYHMGVQGTFMDTGTHNKYFGSIALASDGAFSWDTPAGAAAVEGCAVGAYDARLAALLGAPGTAHLSTVDAILRFTKGVGVVWYTCPCGDAGHESMRPLAAFFGIWHEGARGSREGVHELWWLGTAKLLLVNVGAGLGGTAMYGDVEPAPAWVASFMPAGTAPLASTAFLGAVRPALPQHKALFGAAWQTPLAHLEGGHDANGPPDSGDSGSGGGGGGAVGAAPLVQVYQPPADHAHEEAGHDHSKFMGDLHLPRAGGGGAAPALARMGVLSVGSRVVAAAAPGLDCAAVCAAEGDLSCVQALLPLVNDCASLRGAFPCATCEDSMGADQPAFIATTAPADKRPGACLVNKVASLFSCEGAYEHAQRLCPCAPAKKGATSAARG
jgi:hypothetical protein